jgi:hypothetical protein
VYAVQAEGGIAPITYEWDSGFAPPAWLSLTAQGVLSGTAPAPGPVALVISARDADDRKAARQFQLQVLPVGLAVTTSRLPAALLGQPYTAAVSVTGGVPPYVFDVVSGGTPVAGGHTTPARRSFTVSTSR